MSITTPDIYCDHVFVDGFGGMGDAIVCAKCGLDKYPEAMGLWPDDLKELGAIGKYIPTNHPDYESWAAKAREARNRRRERKED